MGFWRSLRQWWSWDGNPDTDPFRDRASARESDDEDGTVSGHAHAPSDTEPGDSTDEEP